ncbi:hypothetical protein CVT26_011255 [Gymnopilus dilepis]|uniref:DUF1766-domain-containing protein n=1 Tax=Gymnopilus dilepis TaxID=231916 RepID=A0A409VZ02_9AGAR|nr:hypothetical protein CVT26_011255 [Gymnopilus dilepis]
MTTNLSAKEKGKKTARDFLYKLADSFEVKSKKQDGGTTSSPKSSTPSSVDHLSTKFETLAMSESPEYVHHSHFVGGFRPIVQGELRRGNNGNMASTSAPALPVPFGISSHIERPQSLTMQMALAPEQFSPLINRIHSNPFPSSCSEQAQEGRNLRKLPAATAHTSISAVIKSNKSDVSRTSPRSPRKFTQVQCSGITKTGKRCNRQIKVNSPFSVRAHEDEDEDAIERFCYQHITTLLQESGFQSRKTDTWVKFGGMSLCARVFWYQRTYLMSSNADWIPHYLQPETQASLRAEMDKTRSQFDEPGYIYAFQIREHDNGFIKLKVGRTVNLVKRLDEWNKQCGSKEQTLKGFYPDVPESSRMKGRVKAGEKALWCHRLERLVHLELRDLASSLIYLDPAWPKVQSNTVDAISSTTEAIVSSKAAPVQACPDCGSMHKEIFEFRRWTGGENEGKEWERLVKPVIERWGMFVELYV